MKRLLVIAILVGSVQAAQSSGFHFGEWYRGALRHRPIYCDIDGSLAGLEEFREGYGYSLEMYNTQEGKMRVPVWHSAFFETETQALKQLDGHLSCPSK